MREMMECAICHQPYRFEGYRCAVIHAEGECCHYEQTCGRCGKNVGPNDHCLHCYPQRYTMSKREPFEATQHISSGGTVTLRVNYETKSADLEVCKDADCATVSMRLLELRGLRETLLAALL